MVKTLPANAENLRDAEDVRDTGSIPGLGRLPGGGGHGNPLQYSCLENSKDRGVWQAAVHGSQGVRSQTLLKRLSTACMKNLEEPRLS